jgi:hypothetical protein
MTPDHEADDELAETAAYWAALDDWEGKAYARAAEPDIDVDNE